MKRTVAIAIACWAVTANAADALQPKTEKRADIAPTKTVSLTRASLLGVDADGDGIRDDIEAIAAKVDGADDADNKVSATQDALAALNEPKTVKKAPQRRTCMDYLLIGGKDRANTDLRMQQRTSGVIGAHPCDPVVSPLIERPFETDFAHLDLGPISLRY